jgi:Double zinc ribbon
MPQASNLSRPIVALANVRNYFYHIKKIEIVEAEGGKQLHPKNINYLIIYPIESKYWILFNDRIDRDGLPLPLQDLKEVNKVTTTKSIIPIKQISFIPKKGEQFIELSFIGNKFFTPTNKPYIATIKVDDYYIDEIIKLLRTLRQLQYDSGYWQHHTMKLNESTFDIYRNAPYLGDGEEMVWQRLMFQVFNKERKITNIDAVTNCRVFQYNYRTNQGTGILFPSLHNETVSNQHPTTSTDPIGNYFVTSFNLTGIKEPASPKILGDISFQGLDKSTITFTEITDPDTLSTAIRRLKEKHANTVVDGNVAGEITSDNKTEATVKCSKCQSNNTSDSKFCNKCGSQLSMLCGKCGGSNTLSSLFCSQCGTKLAL